MDTSIYIDFDILSAWEKQIFVSKMARTGGFVRRSVADVIRLGNPERLARFCRANHFSMTIEEDQIVFRCKPNWNLCHYH